MANRVLRLTSDTSYSVNPDAIRASRMACRAHSMRVSIAVLALSGNARTGRDVKPFSPGEGTMAYDATDGMVTQCVELSRKNRHAMPVVRTIDAAAALILAPASGKTLKV